MCGEEKTHGIVFHTDFCNIGDAHDNVLPRGDASNIDYKNIVWNVFQKISTTSGGSSIFVFDQLLLSNLNKGVKVK